MHFTLPWPTHDVSGHLQLLIDRVHVCSVTGVSLASAGSLAVKIVAFLGPEAGHINPYLFQTEKSPPRLFVGAGYYGVMLCLGL